jgi:tRNA (mo5U34)-methyltransferase
MLNARRKRRAIDKVGFWFHSIDLGDGVITPGRKTPEVLAAELERLDLPDLRDQTVLDIGGWDGYFAFQAEQAGATRVALLDHYVWSLDFPAQQRYCCDCQTAGVEPEAYETLPFWQPDTLPGKIGFDTARDALGSNVETIVADFAHDDLAPHGTWDVVLFLGVLYHLQEPFAALKRLRALTRRLAVIETQAIDDIPGQESTPLWQFYPGRELGGDPTNWWAPNLAGLQAALLAAGFAEVTVKQGPPRAIVHARPSSTP